MSECNSQQSAIVHNHSKLKAYGKCVDCGGPTFGEGKKVSFDEFEVITTVASDGNSFERVTKYGDQIHAKGTLNKQGFFDNPMVQSQAAALVAQERFKTPKEALNYLWEEEKSISSHQKAHMMAYDSDGEMNIVEHKATVYDWRHI